MELVGERPSGITAVFRKGDVVTIDGSSGKIYSGEVPTVIAGYGPFCLLEIYFT